MEQEQEQEQELTRKFTVRDTAAWTPDSQYWNSELREWVRLHDATIYDSFADATTDALLLKAHVTATWIDQTAKS